MDRFRVLAKGFGIFRKTLCSSLLQTLSVRQRLVLFDTSYRQYTSAYRRGSPTCCAMTILPFNIPVESLLTPFNTVNIEEPYIMQPELFIEFYYVDRVHLFVTYNRRHYYVSMFESDTVIDLMLKIQSDTERFSSGIHIDCQTLHKDGEEMELHQPLSYFNIHPENTSFVSPAKLEISFQDSEAGTAAECEDIWNKLIECPGINCS